MSKRVTKEKLEIILTALWGSLENVRHDTEGREEAVNKMITYQEAYKRLTGNYYYDFGGKIISAKTRE